MQPPSQPWWLFMMAEAKTAHFCAQVNIIPRGVGSPTGIKQSGHESRDGTKLKLLLPAHCCLPA